MKREIKDALIGIMGMINSVAKKWVDTGMKETPEEMIDFLVPFIFKRKLLVTFLHFHLRSMRFKRLLLKPLDCGILSVLPFQCASVFCCLPFNRYPVKMGYVVGYKWGGS